jgi:uncharacterized membrane protein
MRPSKNASRPAARTASTARSRPAKLFKVLVLGGAVLATASAVQARTAPAAAAAQDGGPTDGGGTQGW